MTVRINDKIVSGTFPAVVQIGDIGFAPLGIDESLNLRRYLNGQIISQSLSPAFTAKVKSAITLHPTLGITEADWQSEKTLSKLGQCGKFVVDDTEGTIRLPAIVNAQGLLSLSAIGTIKEESLPNITGSIAIASYEPWSDYQTGALYKSSQTHAIDDGNDNQHPSLIVNLDASRSSSTYQTDASVQQEAVQYPYYIQVATGVEETPPAIREYEINTPFFFGQSQYFEVAPQNASWLVSNGQYNSSSVYPDFWTQLTGVELNSSLNVGDTIEIGGKTYVKRGLPVVLSSATYTDYDFVVDSANNQFRLPLLNGEEDLPGNTFENITYNGHGSTYTATKNGTFCIQGYSSTADLWLSNLTAGTTISTEGNPDAQSVAQCFIEAKKGDTVQAGYYNGTVTKFGISPAVGNGTLYYYVGDTVQDASLINAGAVLNTLSGKIGYDDLTTVHCVVDTYQSGTSWYRVYDDGWVEQGGFVASVAADYQVCQVAFLKNFSNTNYYFNVRYISTSWVNAVIGVVADKNRTTSSVYIWNYSTYSSGAYWYACGYGA